MSCALLLVDHGSRRAEANALLERVAEQLRERAPDRIVEIAHMELAEPTLAQGIGACVAAGAKTITVHPYFLGPGRHTARDIPALVAEAARAHPGLEVRISEPLGLHEKIVDVILERIAAAEGGA